MLQGLKGLNNEWRTTMNRKWSLIVALLTGIACFTPDVVNADEIGGMVAAKLQQKPGQCVRTTFPGTQSVVTGCLRGNFVVISATTNVEGQPCPMTVLWPIRGNHVTGDFCPRGNRMLPNDRQVFLSQQAFYHVRDYVLGR